MSWIIYLVIGAVHCLGIVADIHEMQLYSKILLMPSLALAWWYHSDKDNPMMKVVLASIFFSWLGDLFLMSRSSQLYFSLGLSSFLIAHIFYIKVFYNEVIGRQKFGLVQSKPYLMLPYFAYGFFLLYLVFGNLGVLKIPVTIYAIVLLSMSIFALNRYRSVLNTSFAMVFIGSLLFIFSDSMIAINAFYKEFDLSRIVIMSTYIAAQYLIVRGLSLSKN